MSPSQTSTDRIERRVAARCFRLLRFEETDVFPRPAAVARIGHPDREVLTRAHDAKAHPSLPPLVVPDEVFRMHSRLAFRDLPGGKVVCLLEPEVAKCFGVRRRVCAGKRADRMRAIPGPHEILDRCDLLLRSRRRVRARRRREGSPAIRPNEGTTNRPHTSRSYGDGDCDCDCDCDKVNGKLRPGANTCMLAGVACA
jgi:hypothetical protein